MKFTLSILIIFLIAQADLSKAQTNAPSSRQTDQKAGGSSSAHSGTQKESTPAEAGATSTSPMALPFKNSWQYLTDSASNIQPTLDGTRIYLPLAGGRVLCLDRKSGGLLWSSEPGGEVSAPIVAVEKVIYVATRLIAEDGSEAGASLRAMDKTTGLTVWAHDYRRPYTSPLAIGAGRIYAGSADGAFYALSAEDGETIWKAETQDVVRGRALITDGAIYFGSDDGALRSVAPESGHELWKFQTAGKIVGRPAIGKQEIYFGSGDGYLYAVDLKTHKLRWRSRTGAAIEASPVLTGDRVLVASFDNFIYALSQSNGDRIWKRRLDNRITADPVVEGDSTMITPLRGDHIAIFLTSDGRRVNYYKLDRGVEIVADPIFSDDTLVIATDKGIVVAVSAQPVEDAASAIDK